MMPAALEESVHDGKRMLDSSTDFLGTKAKILWDHGRVILESERVIQVEEGTPHKLLHGRIIAHAGSVELE